VDAKYIRAWPGGTGNIKYGGNYGSTVISQKEAASGGASQSLYVYDKEEYVTEAGTMNIFFLWRDRETGEKTLVTPTLEDGTILPGVTRQSVIDLARAWGECEVVEKMLPFGEAAERFERGEMLEIFGTGTAAVIQPVGFIRYGRRRTGCPRRRSSRGRSSSGSRTNCTGYSTERSNTSGASSCEDAYAQKKKGGRNEADDT
jgi:branched-chain amino acid aminotransferase